MVGKKMFRTLMLWSALTMTATGAAMAQSVTQGAISGTVEDATGAIIPASKVVIHNNGTNADVTLTADTKGYFNVPLLQPGEYTVTIMAGGFGNYVEKRVVVEVGQSTELHPRLNAGGNTETVTVEAATPLLNYDSPDFTDVIDNRAIINIPENNRRWSSLALLTPGVVSDANGFGLVSVRGISTLLNNVEIDGADDNQAYFSEERGRTREAYSTSEDAVREFQVNTGVYSAEYGRAAGGVITSVTKSGTNAFHGEVYGYDRQSNWAAYTPLVTNTTATPNGSGGYTFNTFPLKPKDLRKIVGFAAGGAIIKDKLFWYYTFDEHRHIFPGTGKPANPGTFFLTPDTTLPAGTCSLTTGTITAPKGSTVSTIDNQACTLAAREGLASYGAGAAAYTTGLASILTDLGSVPRIGDQEINTPKLDFQISPKQRLTLLYHRLRWDSPGGVQTQATNTYAVDTFGNDFVKLDYGVAKLESQITARINNELGYQYSRELDYETQQPFSAYTRANLTGTGASAGNVPEISLDTPGSTGVYLGSPYYSYRTAYPDERKWQVFDTVYYVKGNHSFKFGTDILHNYDLINNLYESNGVYTYTYIGNYLADLHSRSLGATTDSCTSTAPSTGGPGTYPCYSSVTEGFGLTPQFGISTLDYGFFAQDNWKVTPRLSLELGIRYDYESLPNASSSLTAPTTVVNPAGATTYTFTPPAGLTNRPSDQHNIGPRVGFSYDLFGTGLSVLRAGVGLYYGREINATILNAYLNTGSPLGQYTTTFKTTQGGPLLANILPNVTQNSSGAIVSPGAFATPSTYFFSKDGAASNYGNPETEEYDLQLQQQLGKGNVFQIGYLASSGRHLPNFLNLNLNPATEQNVALTFQPSTLSPNNCGPVACGTTVTIPTYTSYSNPAFQGITEITSNINSSYNAFVAEFKSTAFHGLEMDLNYTWSHALDYNQNASTAASTNNWYDPYGSPRVNYGNSNFNVPNRVTGYALYDFPGISRSNWVSYLTNHWSLNDSFQGQSGLPYSYGTSSYNSTAAVSTGFNGSGGISYIPFLGRNTLKLKRDLVDDVRVIKGIPFTERYKLELRADFFNIANHQNVTSAGSTAYTFASTGLLSGTATFNPTTFGVPTTVNSSGFLYTPREIQVSARFAF